MADGGFRIGRAAEHDPQIGRRRDRVPILMQELGLLISVLLPT
jgi:hypothetical protein